MQPENQQSYQEPPVDAERGPVVSLTPEGGPVVAPTPGVDEQRVAAEAPQSEPIRWQAPEYIHREKDHIWFVVFVLVTLGLIALAVYVIQSRSFAFLLAVMAVTLIVYTRRPPRMLEYTLGRHGLYINDQLFPFGDFKSFALIHGLEQYSIMLVPVRRFKPAITINFPEEVGEAIVDTLAARLPMREVQPDLVDRIIRKLHL